MIYVVVEVENEADLTHMPGRVVGTSKRNPIRPNPSVSIRLMREKGWIPHTGTDCPVHPLDVVEIAYSDGEANETRNHEK